MLMPDAASQLARDTDAALLLFVVVSLVILVGVTAALIGFAIHFRRDRVTRTRQIRSNLALELTWTLVPTAIVIAMFFVGYRGFVTGRELPAAGDALVVEVTGQQWFWTFRYPAYDLTTTELTLPLGRNVIVRLTSKPTDVVHSFYVPALRLKEDALPGRVTHLWLNADRVGEYNVFCAEYCGNDHSRMHTLLRVVPPAEFGAWVAKKLQEQYEPVDVAEALEPGKGALAGVDGPALFQTYCASCHGADGRGGGPYNARDFTKVSDWKGVWKRSPRLVDVVRTITQGVPQTNMRSFGHLPVKERLALMHVVAGFAPAAERPPSTPEDWQALKTELPELDPSAKQRQVRLEPRVPIDEVMRRLAAPRAAPDAP